MPVMNVHAGTLKQWLASDEAVLVDVREPAEHEAQNIPGSFLLPLHNVSRGA